LYDFSNITVNKERVGWNTKVFTDPTSLNFWLDFLDSGELMKYSVPEIGLRTKATTNTKLASVYFKSIPNIIFYINDDDAEGWKKFTSDQQMDKDGY
jgi:hypothetical protein